MRQFLKKAVYFLLDILFPPACLSCKKAFSDKDRKEGLCEACQSSIVLFDAPQCMACAARLPENRATCHKNLTFILYASCSYDNQVIQPLIWGLKYEHRRIASEILGTIAFNHYKLSGADWSQYVLVPIPLHSSRFKMRGYNQAELIARSFAKQAGVQVQSELLQKIKHTKPQMKARNWDEREKNVADSFVVRAKTAVPHSVVLVDDVATSGSTLRMAAHTLYEAGVKEVIALVIARAR